MKQKTYRILAVLIAVLLIAGAVFAARTVYVYADGEETDAPGDPPTEAPTDPPTQAPTDPPTQAPTDPPTQAPTDPPTEAPTDPPTEAPTDPPTDTPTDTPTDPPTDTPTDTPPETEHVHSYVEGSRTDATCTEAGQVTYTCSVCGESYTETIPAKGHSWGEWEVITAASYETAGLQKHTCTVCGAEESEEIPAIGYPEGSVVDVVFTVTGGKFSDGSTQKSVPVIKYENGVPSRNGIGHLSASQIPTDMSPDEGYDNGFWGDPEPSPSVNITENTTFAFSYTGTFNYNGTYTSYNGPWRPTTPQGPTQPRPTTPTQPRPTTPTTDNPTETETEEPDLEDILLVNGEAGAFGELITVNGENFWAYHLPAGSYKVKNEGSDPATIDVFSDDTLTNAEGKEVPAQQYLNLVLPAEASSEELVVLEEDRYVRLSEGATVRFLLSDEEETSTEETEEPTTETLTEETDSASESAEASETETRPSGNDDDNRKSLVLWPFILVLSLLLVGLGVLIFFIIRLLKKSDGDSDDSEDEDDSSDSEDE